MYKKPQSEEWEVLKMAYPKKVWSETERETFYPSDLNRMENGIEANDLEITKQKNQTIPGTLAKQIADNAVSIEENANKINDLNNERGYLKTKSLSFNLAIKNGKYVVSNDVDCPDGSTGSTWLLDVTQMNDSYVLQEVFCLYSSLGNTGKKYYRYMVNKVWQPWQPIATTYTKALTLTGGWVNNVSTQLSYYAISGKVCIFYIRCSGGVTTSGTVIAQLPPLVSGDSFPIASPQTGQTLGSGYTMSDGRIYIYTCSTNADIFINGIAILA